MTLLETEASACLNCWFKLRSISHTDSTIREDCRRCRKIFLSFNILRYSKICEYRQRLLSRKEFQNISERSTDNTRFTDFMEHFLIFPNNSDDFRTFPTVSEHFPVCPMVSEWFLYAGDFASDTEGRLHVGMRFERIIVIQLPLPTCLFIWLLIGLSVCLPVCVFCVLG